MRRDFPSFPLGARLIPALLVSFACVNVALAQEEVPAGGQPPVAEPSPVAEQTPVAEQGAMTEEVTVTGDLPEPEDMSPGPVARNVNTEGGVGFHRIASALIGDRLMFRTAFLGEYSNAEDVVRDGDQQIGVSGHLVLQGTLNKYFAANLGLSTRSNINNFGQPETMLSLGDANLGLTGIYPAAEGLNVGVDLGLFLPTDFGSAGPNFSAMSVRPRLLGSLDVGTMTQSEIPLQAHLNVAYRVDNSANAIPDRITDVTRVERLAYELSQYDLFEFGVGFEYTLPYIRPFVGYWMGLPVNAKERNGQELCKVPNQLDCYSDQGFGAAPKIVSLGAKADPVENLGLHAGVDLGLTTKQANGLPVTPPYAIHFGLSWTIDPKPKIEVVEVERVIEKETSVATPAALGRIDGKVVNAEDDSSVKGATVEYLGQDVTPQSTSQTNGTFRSYGFAPGTELKLRISHPDYETAEVDAKVAEQDVPLNVELKPVPKIAEIRGRVLDTEDKPIRTAQVTVNGPGGPFVVPVDAGGNFSKQFKPGAYSIAVRDPAYLTRGRDVTLKANDTLDLEFVLSPKPKQTTAKLQADRIEISEKVFFDTGNATIKTRSFNLLNQIASILLENPAVNIRIEGHTDDQGDDSSNMELSRERAESVRTYLLQQGVSESRLEAKGYGETRPILPNVSNRNRTINRRVEFNVITQPAAVTDP